MHLCTGVDYCSVLLCQCDLPVSNLCLTIANDDIILEVGYDWYEEIS